MKRTLSLILAIVLTLSLLPVTASADRVGFAEKTQSPTKTVYAKGHVFAATDLNGLEIKYREKETDPWTAVAYPAAGFSIESPRVGDKFETVGTQNIHLHYTYATDKYVEIDVPLTVKAALFTGLTVKTEPTKVNYYEGEKIDLTGLELVREYTDGSIKALTDFNASNISFSPSKTDSLTATDATIKVTYTEDGTTITKTIKAISVKAAATSVSLDKSKLDLTLGGADGTLTATILPTALTASDWQWSVQDESIATITLDPTGKTATVKAKAVGTTQITIRSKGSNLDAVCQVNVEQDIDITVPKVLYLNHTGPKEVPIGSTLSLSVIACDPYTTSENKKDVEWTSIDASIASVSSTGLVTAHRLGTTTITCMSKYEYSAGKKATETIVIKVVDMPVTGISLSASAITLYVKGNSGSSRTITATVTPDNASNKAITWASGNTAIATVDSYGKITAVAEGTAQITATAAGGLTATVTVTVKAATLLDELSVTPEIASLYVGQSLTAAIKLHPSTATTQTVTWASSKPEVATVSSSGKITAVAQGTTIITVTADDGSGLSDTIAVTVNNVAVESVLQTAVTATVLETKTVQLYASIFPSTATNKGVTWSSLNTAIATVSSSGLVTGVSKGNVVIRATAKDGSGNYADCVVTVTERTRVSSLSINYKSFTLLLDDSTYLSATILPSNATVQNVEWDSSSPGVATISSTGLLKGVGLGTAVITAEVDGKSASITVTVAGSRSSYGVVYNCARRVNVRSVPDGSRGFLGYAYKGQTYKVIGESGNWYKIQYGSKEAYIWKNYLNFDVATSYVSANTQTAPTTPPSTTTTGTPLAGSTVTVTNCRRRVNVRATPDANATHMGYAYLNDTYSYIATSGDWYQVNYDGVVAYIHMAYCSLSI